MKVWVHPFQRVAETRDRVSGRTPQSAKLLMIKKRRRVDQTEFGRREPRSVKQTCRGHVCSVGCARLNGHSAYQKTIKRAGICQLFLQFILLAFIWVRVVRLLQQIIDTGFKNTG